MQRFGFASAVKLLRVTHKCLIQLPHRAASHFCHEYKNILTQDSKSHTLQQQPCSLLQHLIPSGFKTPTEAHVPGAVTRLQPRPGGRQEVEDTQTAKSQRRFKPECQQKFSRSHPDVWFVCRWRDDVPSFCSLLCSLNTVRN